MKNNADVTIGFLATQKYIESLGKDESRNFLYKTVVRTDLTPTSPGVENNGDDDTSVVYEYVALDDPRVVSNDTGSSISPIQYTGTTASAPEEIFTEKEISKWAYTSIQDSTITITDSASTSKTISVKANNVVEFDSQITSLQVNEIAIDYEFIGEELI